jgi:hypothetical protein
MRVGALELVMLSIGVMWIVHLRHVSSMEKQMALRVKIAERNLEARMPYL